MWQLTVNEKKTTTMILENRKTLERLNLTYKKKPLDIVNNYKFLGCTISKNGSLITCLSDLANKAKKVLFAIKSYTNNFDTVPIKVAVNLLKTLLNQY